MKLRLTIAAAAFALLAPAAGARAQTIETSPELTKLIEQGRELVFNGKYDDALKLFGDYERKHPKSLIGSFGQMLALQARMYEGLNFSEDAAYQAIYERHKKLADGMHDPLKRRPWEALIKAAGLGMHGVYATRKQKWFDALTMGARSIAQLSEFRRRYPDFPDAKLGDGMLFYWRGFMASKLSFIPAAPEEKQKGITMLEDVAKNGIFMAPIAEFALMYVNYNEKRYKQAKIICNSLMIKYPGNYVVRLMKGRLYYKTRKNRTALKHLERLYKDRPDVPVALYHMGLAELNLRRYKSAKKHLEEFVSHKDIEDRWLAFGNYRLGYAHEGMRDYAAARGYYRKSMKYDDNYEPPAEGIERVEKKLAKLEKRERDRDKRRKKDEPSKKDGAVDKLWDFLKNRAK